MSEMALTADHLIVIGRGQLLADMSVKDFISRNSADFARVRTPDTEPQQREKLTAALTEAGGQVLPEQDGALRVTGLPLPRISDLAHDAGRTAVGALAAPGLAGGGVHADDAGRRRLPLDRRPAGRASSSSCRRARMPPQQMPVPGQGQPGWYAPPPPQQGGQPFATPQAQPPRPPRRPYGAPAARQPRRRSPYAQPAGAAPATRPRAAPPPPRPDLTKPEDAR